MKKRIRSLLLTTLLMLTMPMTVSAAGSPTVLDLSLGSITISSTGASGGGVSESTLNPAGYIIQQSNPVVTVNKITVATSTSLTLSSVNISTSGCAFSITGAAVSLTIEGANTLISGSRSGYAGLQVPAGSSVTIDGTGLLNVTGGGDAAGIGGAPGGGLGTITIAGGTIHASSTSFRAGSGAAIGSGGTTGVSGGAILITGGTIVAQGGSLGTGIGGGSRSSGTSVTITGGDVTATGGQNASGIGTAYGAGSNTVTITGGKVNATGGERGAGIGGGFAGLNGGTVTISGGEVTATGGLCGAGIGGGSVSGSNTIHITGGTVVATGGEYGAGIGGGLGNNNPDMGVSGTIVISGGLVQATGGTSAAGIGKGASVVTNTGSVTAAGGTITALGGAGASDIGTPAFLTGGSLKANSFESPPTDGTTNVYRAALENLPANAAVSALTLSKAGQPFAYGLPKTVHSDGKLYLYLPASAIGENYRMDLNAGGLFKIGAFVQSSGTDLLAPYEAGFDKNNPSDITAMTLNGTFSAIKNGSDTLVRDTDYTVSGSTVTIAQRYLRTLPLGTSTLSFGFGSGAVVNLTVTVADSAPPPLPSYSAILKETTAEFDTGAQQDVPIGIISNGNTLLTVQKGTTVLVDGVDYTLSGSTVMLKKEFLETLPVGDTLLTFTFSNGGIQTLTVTVEGVEAEMIPATGEKRAAVLPFVLIALFMLGIAGFARRKEKR